jgi:hypothetical protein
MSIWTLLSAAQVAKGQLSTDELLTPGRGDGRVPEAKLHALVSHGVSHAVQASPCAQRTPMGGSKGVIERKLSPTANCAGSKGGEGAAGASCRNDERRSQMAGERPSHPTATRHIACSLKQRKHQALATSGDSYRSQRPAHRPLEQSQRRRHETVWGDKAEAEPGSDL